MSDKPNITVITDECIYEEFGDVSTQAVLPRDFHKAWRQAQKARKMMRIHSPQDTKKNKEEKQ